MPHPIACGCYLCRTEEEMSGRLAVRHVPAPAPAAPAPTVFARLWPAWADETLLAEVAPGGTPTREQCIANAARILAALDARIGRHGADLPASLCDIRFDIECAMLSLDWPPSEEARR